MILTVEPSRTGLRGDISPPGDKSISHRALIMASLAQGQSLLSGLLSSEDTLATLRACVQLGASSESVQGGLLVTGTGGKLTPTGNGVLDMGNSGTAMRLLAGVLSGQDFDTTLVGDDSLNSRPMTRIVDPLRLMGADITPSDEGTAPLLIRSCGGLRGINYVSPVTSAQIKSCVLLAGLAATGVSSVEEPRLSRDHTERMLPLFGVELVSPRCVRGGSRLMASNFDVPGDISSAVFLLAAAAMVPGSEITIRRVGLNPTRTGFLQCMREMGAQLTVVPLVETPEPVGDVKLVFADRLKGIVVPESRVPDMIDELPLLMALAATGSGMTRIRGAGELRVKESDRIAVMATGLRKMGVNLQEYPDGMDIEGGTITGGSVNSAGDHRCAMSFALLGLRASSEVHIDAAQYIATSYPGFIDDMRAMGASMFTDTGT